MLTIDTGRLPPEALRPGDWRNLASVLAKGEYALGSYVSKEAALLRSVLGAMKQQCLRIADSIEKDEAP